MKKRFHLFKKTLLAAAFIHLPATAFAAELEEIIVTATKRAESLQDVGLSVQAFDASSLQEGGITDVSRLEFLVSGVNYAFVGNDAKFNVRGANSSNTFGDATSIVGTFVDGVYKPRASQQSRSFFDIERVEFLKGPQGTLYGRNTFAGAMNLYTRVPDLDAGTSGFAELGIERFGRIAGEGAVNFALSDTFGIRVAGTFDQSDGYITNLAGPDLGEQDDMSIRISALWEASDRVSWLFRYQRSEEQGVEAGLFGYVNICRREQANGLTDAVGPVTNCANPQRGSSGTPVYLQDTGPYTISQDYAPPIDLEEDSFTLTVDFDLGSVSVKSITSYSDFVNNIGFDFDFSPVPHSRGGFDEEIQSFSQEIQIASNTDSALQWTSGLYYSKDELFTSFSILDLTDRDDSVRATVTLPDGTDLTVFSGTPIVSTDIFLRGFFADADFREATTAGIYGEAEWAFSDATRLTLGLRYSEEDKDLLGAGSNFTGDTNGDGTVDRAVNVILPGGAADSIPAFSREAFSINPNATDSITDSRKYDNVTFRVGFEHDLNDESLLYGTVSTGFLSGAVNRAGATDEQESIVYEIGYKSYLLDNTLKLNAALHFTEYDNLLTQRQIPTPAGTIVTVSDNGGDIEARGVEVEAVYVPTDELKLGLNLTLLDSEYGTFGANNPFQLFNGEVQSFIDLEGLVTPWSPDLTMSLTASYRFDLGDGGSITPHIQFYYSDEYYTSNLLGPVDLAQLQDSFTKTDIRVIWESVDAEYSIEGFVENLEDEAVLARGNSGSQDNVQSGFLYPRNAGIRFRAHF